MFDRFKAKNRVFEFDHQQMNMFEFVRCSKNDVRVRSMFNKMVFDPSLQVRAVRAFLQSSLDGFEGLTSFYKVAGSVDTKISTELFCLEKWQNNRTLILHIIYPFQCSGRRWNLNSIVSQKVVTFSKARNSQWNNKKGHFLTTVPDENCAFDAVSCNI